MAHNLMLTRRPLLTGLLSSAPALWFGHAAGATGLISAPTGEPQRVPIGDWDQGTVTVEGTTSNGRLVKRAYSWSPTGYVLVENGEVLARWGTP